MSKFDEVFEYDNYSHQGNVMSQLYGCHFEWFLKERNVSGEKKIIYLFNI